jgi:CDP-diacylglycerol--serine O-phosphatidyltransferase
MFITFWLEPALLADLQIRASIVIPVVIAVSLMMASSLPTFAWGSVRVRPAWRLPALAAVGLFAGSLFTAPWMTLSLLCVAYFLSMPLAFRSYARAKARIAEAPSI